MSKRKVLLADSSYTIRRIVELSFSEEPDIELITTETGTQLKEQIAQLHPDIVLVDIRLPEFNGYQACEFINQDNSLKNTKVFLLKGGFEPVNEELLKELDYIDIITKPFDSNALVSSVKKLLAEAPPPAAPPSVPEELDDSFPDILPEIPDLEAKEEVLSFSDVKQDILSSDLADQPRDSETDDYVRDEVLPSEEITQGSQYDKEDNLKPEAQDEMENPFAEDNDQSLDQLLEREIEKEKRSSEKKDSFPDIGEYAFSAEEESIPADSLETPDEQEPVFSREDTAKVSGPGENEIKVLEEQKDVQDFSSDTLSESELQDSFAIDEKKPQEEMFTPGSNEEDLAAPVEAPAAEVNHETKENKIDNLEIELNSFEQKLKEETEPEKPLSDITGSEEEPPPIPQDYQEAAVAETGPVEFDLIPDKEAVSHDMPAAEKKIPGPGEPAQPEPAPQSASPLPDKEELMKRMEDKLSTAVKEILWEIVPPLAERVIKEEIKKIEDEIDHQD